jgi:hypothetical protein
MCEKQVYLWNWKKQAFHLVMRYRREFYDLFKFGSELSDIVTNLPVKGGNEQLSDVSTSG